MIFKETPLQGLITIDLEKHRDGRGFFARTMCQREFEAQNLPSNFVQCNTSFNKEKGTLRGMHYQKPPAAEGKLIRCTCGGIWDVAIDLRPDSKTCKQWFGTELTQENGRSLFVPPGFAHGFITLVPDTEVLYMMTEFYQPDLATGVRWNDPAFSIQWPTEPAVISDRDASYPDFKS